MQWKERNDKQESTEITEGLVRFFFINNLSSVITVTLYLPRPNNWVKIKYVQYKNKKFNNMYSLSFFLVIKKTQNQIHKNQGMSDGGVCLCDITQMVILI